MADVRTQLVLPRERWVDLRLGREHPLGQAGEELLLVAEVPVDGSGIGSQLGPDPAHRQRPQTLGADDPLGGRQNHLAVQAGCRSNHLHPHGAAS
jgi:hypothetical protein